MMPDPQHPPLVMIADAHVSRQHGNVDGFFEMLKAIDALPCDVVFLGDIFDLWVALPRYENDLHRAFLSWCRSQKRRRRIGFVEGNHEFFVAQAHAAAFSWCTARSWWDDGGGNLFCHGDRINRTDRSYLAFRKATKNVVTKTIMGGLPMGPRWVDLLKDRLKHTNQAFRKRLPVDQLRRFAEDRFKEGAVRIFVGHFHQAFVYRGNHGSALHTLPAWHSQGRLSILAGDRKGLQQGCWPDLLPRMAL